MIEEFETMNSLPEFGSVLEHHDSNLSAQKHFITDVEGMYDALAELGNPFLDDSADLYALDTKLVPGQQAIKNLYALENIGKEQFKTYMDKRVLNNYKPISDTITKNNLQIFKCPEARKVSKKDAQLKAARSDAALFQNCLLLAKTEMPASNSFLLTKTKQQHLVSLTMEI